MKKPKNECYIMDTPKEGDHFMKRKIKFVCLSNSKIEKASQALDFLKNVSGNNQLGSIENIDYVFDCLDISGDLEYLEQKLKENHIDY